MKIVAGGIRRLVEGRRRVRDSGSEQTAQKEPTMEMDEKDVMDGDRQRMYMSRPRGRGQVSDGRDQ